MKILTNHLNYKIMILIFFLLTFFKNIIINNYHMLHSISIVIKTFISLAYSRGSSFITGLKNQLTIIASACSSDIHLDCK